jgi:methylaspartate mutase sigma subunit
VTRDGTARPRPGHPPAAPHAAGRPAAAPSAAALTAAGPALDIAGPGRRLDVVVTSVSSDAHTWNLVYLQLLLEELGCRVTNLGGCTPDETVVTECVASAPDLVVVSSLNGHGAQDGVRLAGAIRSRPELAATPVVIGGKLDVTGGEDRTAERLLAAGFDAVFQEHDGGTIAFRSFVHSLAAGTGVPMVAR